MFLHLNNKHQYQSNNGKKATINMEQLFETFPVQKLHQEIFDELVLSVKIFFSSPPFKKDLTEEQYSTAQSTELFFLVIFNIEAVIPLEVIEIHETFSFLKNGNSRHFLDKIAKEVENIKSSNLNRGISKNDIVFYLLRLLKNSHNKLFPKSGLFQIPYLGNGVFGQIKFTSTKDIVICRICKEAIYKGEEIAVQFGENEPEKICKKCKDICGFLISQGKTKIDFNVVLKIKQAFAE